MKLMFVGDVSLGEYYMSFGHGPRSRAYSEDLFRQVQRIFSESDAVIGNLEAPITGSNYDMAEPESMVLKVDPEHAGLLGQTGFRVMQVANNHTVQHGDDAFDETIEILRNEGISAVGLQEQEPYVIEHEGISIAIVAASDVPDNTNKRQVKYQRLDDTLIKRVISSAEQYDHFIVMLHWGLETSTAPLPYQRELVEKLYQAGVSAVIGSHPHLCYEIEKRDKFVVAYSLGNFVFDLCWDSRLMKTGILELDFTKDEIDAQFWPVDIRNDGSLPTPHGSPVRISGAYVPYDLGLKMDFQQPKKVWYLITNLFKGYTRVKLRFFQRKISALFTVRKSEEKEINSIDT